MAAPSTPNQIYIITQVAETEDVTIIEGERDGRTDTGGGWGTPSRSPIESFRHTFKRQRIGLNVNDLKAQMQDLLAVVNDLFDTDSPHLPGNVDNADSADSADNVDNADNRLQLEEVTLSVEVNAKGQLSILGTGGELGGSGGITLKFARPKK